MLDEIDRRLILALQEDGRASHVELSRKLGIHVATVAKRIQVLLESETIKIRAVPNPYKLNYSAHALIALQVEKGCEDKVCARLCANFNVNLVITAFGRFDILAIVYFASWDDVLHFISSNLSAASGVLNVETLLIKDFKKRHYGQFKTLTNLVKIDEVDRRIIEKLSENGRYTARDLARELAISVPTCLRRLSVLLKEKAIEVRAIPNPSTIGVSANAFILLQIRADRIESVCTALSRYEDVFLLATLYNGFHILLGISAPDAKKLHRLIKNEVLSTDYIISSETVILAEVKKRYYGKYMEEAQMG